MQCAMELRADGSVKPLEHPINGGKLCVLGLSSGALVSNGDRIVQPLVRRHGELVATTWEHALEVATLGFIETARTFGKSATAAYGGGSLSNEKSYLVGKFARTILQTPHIDYNGRYCMSSAAAAQNIAFGMDRGLNRPLADIQKHDLIFIAGSNAAECLPMLMPHFQEAKKNGATFVTVDPRKTTTSNLSTLHLQIRPGSDLALANGLLNKIISTGKVNEKFVQTKTVDFSKAATSVSECSEAWSAEMCGVSEADLEIAFELLVSAKNPLILTGRGADQNSRGVKTSLSYINLALALGAEFGTLTGQANGQGGREMGQKADQLAGYRNVENMEDRKHMAKVWGVEESSISGKGLSAFEILEAIGRKEIRAMLVLGSNPIVSSPNSDAVRKDLAEMDHLVVVDSFMSETARNARVVLPGAIWSEEDGTTTNLEGRVVLRKALQAPPEGAKTDLEILCDLAKRLGGEKLFPYENSEEVFEEIRLATRGAKADYSGIDWSRLEAGEELFWPCGVSNPAGTPRPFVHQFAHPDGLARFSATPYTGLTEQVSTSRPLYLTTGRILYHYLTGNLTHRIERLEKKVSQPYVEVHPDTAALLGLVESEFATLETDRGTAQYSVKLSSKIRPDTLFVPFHWEEKLAINRLMKPVLDPVSRMPEFKFATASITPVLEVLNREVVLQGEVLL